MKHFTLTGMTLFSKAYSEILKPFNQQQVECTMFKGNMYVQMCFPFPFLIHLCFFP